MTKFITSTVTMLCIFLAGCASTDSAPESVSNDDCFHIREVNGWSVIDKDHVYLEELGNDNYLVTLFSPAPG